MSKSKAFFRVFTESGPLIALAVATALLLGIAGPASAQFFNWQFRWTAAVATAQQRIRGWI
jgi:hypothetical protein